MDFKELNASLEKVALEHFQQCAPSLITNIQELLVRGEPKRKILAAVRKGVAVNSTTYNLAEHLVDHLQKQIKK